MTGALVALALLYGFGAMTTTMIVAEDETQDGPLIFTFRALVMFLIWWVILALGVTAALAHLALRRFNRKKTTDAQ
jgi:hypothetical protein